MNIIFILISIATVIPAFMLMATSLRDFRVEFGGLRSVEPTFRIALAGVVISQIGLLAGDAPRTDAYWLLFNASAMVATWGFYYFYKAHYDVIEIDGAGNVKIRPDRYVQVHPGVWCRSYHGGEATRMDEERLIKIVKAIDPPKDAQVVLYQIRQGSKFPEHTKDCYEVFWWTKGEGYLRDDVAVTAADPKLIPAGYPHYVKVTSDVTGVSVIYPTDTDAEVALAAMRQAKQIIFSQPSGASGKLSGALDTTTKP